ncbi:hypothetical protein L9G70_11495 [Morganella morganii]|uniref:hypothetical protein n=1 Tax=Morganella morganii TaxID=582 RepID=UPI0023DD9818|nr:hypothetical protein [Morganella morganii]ELF0883600.1 hypothetical protein [Morganella morganii]MDF2406274.1 hypothetical protein [Morganella morganii]
MKKIIVLIALLIFGSFSVQAAGQYPDCKKDYDKQLVLNTIKKNHNIKYQMQQGWEVKKLWKERSAGLVNPTAGTKECTAYSKLVKPGHRIERLMDVSYSVRYRNDGTVETHVHGFTIVKNFIPKNKR